MSCAPPQYPAASCAEEQPRDTRAWLSSLLIGIGFGALAMLFSLVVWQQIHPGWGWYQGDDVWTVVRAGRMVWYGALGYVYEGTRSYALPLSFILMAPVSGLCDHLGLVGGSPVPLARPSAWLLVGPYTLSFGILVLHAVRALAWDLGLRRRVWAVQVLAVVLALVPIFEWGHFEDGIALAAILYAARRLLRGDYLMAAVFLSVAVASKQWAVTLIPLVVFSAPRGSRLRCAVAACALPGALTLFVLGVDFHDAFPALFAERIRGGAAVGHVTFYTTWFGKATSRYSRSAGIAVATLAAWKMARARSAPLVLAAVSVILALRPLFEAVSFSYYFSPALVMAGMVGIAAHHRVRLRDWVWQIGAIAWAMPFGNQATAGWWWAGEAALLAATALQMAVNLNLAAGRRPSAVYSVKKRVALPILNSMTTPTKAGDGSWTR